MRFVAFFNSLSARVLTLTVAFVMFSGLLIFPPTIAREYRDILQQKMDVILLAYPYLSKGSEKSLLKDMDVFSVTFYENGRQIGQFSQNIQPLPEVSVDLRGANFDDFLWESHGLLGAQTHRAMRLTSYGDDENTRLEVILDEAPIQYELLNFVRTNLILWASISVIVGTLVFFVLQQLLVRPMQKMVMSMTAFRLDPENGAHVMEPEDRVDEIGMAQQELAHMQHDLRAALQQKTRLAALGTAITKISHDLRHILTVAGLVTERLTHTEDEKIQKMAPQLVTSIDQAIRLATTTLDYAREGGIDLVFEPVGVAGLVQKVRDDLIMDHFDLVVQCDVDAGHHVTGDRDQLYRVLFNLMRNSVQAGATHIVVGMENEKIMITDNGGGLSHQAQEKLFQPFAGSSRTGGTGLGLVIARDIMRAHGGDLLLVSSDQTGTIFHLIF